ncbi:MAG: hypothetical protein AB7J35_05265 [Dehalococcoidia bacterium]
MRWASAEAALTAEGNARGRVLRRVGRTGPKPMQVLGRSAGERPSVARTVERRVEIISVATGY